jgi:hypothetical protein
MSAFTRSLNVSFRTDSDDKLRADLDKIEAREPASERDESDMEDLADSIERELEGRAEERENQDDTPCLDPPWYEYR